jgi:hypothetical protein
LIFSEEETPDNGHPNTGNVTKELPEIQCSEEDDVDILTANEGSNQDLKIRNPISAQKPTAKGRILMNVNLKLKEN